MDNFFDYVLTSINVFDTIVAIIFLYFIFQCSLKGFSLSLILFMKWVFSTIITILLVPKLQPTVSNYVESEFINNVGIGVGVFVTTLFLTIFNW